MTETLRGNKFKDLNMTKEEIERFTEAMKKEEFRKLLVEYAEEISDPKNREIYEQEITKLEEERGMNVTFVHPEPGFCLKTIQNGDKKCFINICKNTIIEKPSCNREPSKSDSKNSKPGLYWSIPHTCSPPREDLDHTGKNKCVVFDVVFHPDAYRMGETNQRFKQLLKDTAMDTIENNFHVKLDRNNLKELKNINFKGRPTASVLRKPVNANSNKENENKSAGNEENDPMGKFVDQLKQQYLENQSNSAKLNKPTPVTQKTDINNNKSSAEETTNGYTEPKYKIVHRGKFDIEDCTNQTDQRVVNSTRPKELFISIELPLCKSSEQLTLDIFEKRLYLESNEPNYKLDLNLPYPINESESKAKFDKSKRCLNVTLPVVPFVAQLDLSKMNESIESIEKNNSSASFSPSSSSDSSSSSSLSSSPTPDLTNIQAELEQKSPIAQVKYNLAQPCSVREYKNKLVVKFKVPSYTKESISVHIDSECMFNIKCESTSASGAYIQYYAAYVRFYYVKSLERQRKPESGDNDLGSYNCVEANFEVNDLDEDTFEVKLEKNGKVCDQSEIEVKKAYVTLKQSELAEIESNSSDSDDSRSFFIVDIGQDFVNSDLDDTNCANKMSKKDFIMNFSNISNSEQLDEDDDDENESEKEKKKDDQEETKVKFELDEEMDKYSNVGKKIYEKLKMTKSIVHDLNSLQDKIDEEAEDEKDYLLSQAENKEENEEDNEEDDNKDSLEKSHDNNSLSSSSNFTDSLGSSLNSSSFGKLKGILKKPRSFSESESSMMGHRDSLPGVSADSKLSVGSCSGNSDENNNDSCSTCKKSVSFNKQVVRNVFKPGSTVGGMKKPNSNKNKKKNNKRKRTLSDPSHDADTLKDSADDSSAFRNRSVSESSDDSSSIMTNSTESLPETAKPIENQQAETSNKKKKNKKNKKQAAKQADAKAVEEKKNPFDMETMLEWKNQGRLPMEDATHKTNCAVKFKNNIMNDLDD